MHITIIAGESATTMLAGASGTRLVLLLFLLLKTGAHVAAHLKKHARAPPETGPLAASRPAPSSAPVEPGE